jgi:hypothetical protein
LHDQGWASPIFGLYLNRSHGLDDEPIDRSDHPENMICAGKPFVFDALNQSLASVLRSAVLISKENS